MSDKHEPDPRGPGSAPSAGAGPAPASGAAGGTPAGGTGPRPGRTPSPPRRAVTAGTAPATGRPATVRKAGHQGASRRQATSLEQERLREVDRRGVVLGLMTAGAAVAVGSVIALCSQVRGPAVDESIPATGRVVETTVTVSGMRFVPDTVDVAPGDRLVITLDNTADMVHDLVLENGATTGRVAAGQRAELDAGVIRGPVEGWCSIAGHRAHGMVFHVTTGSF